LPAANKHQTGKLEVKNGRALGDLGKTRADLRTSEEDRLDRLGGLVRQQVIAQFKQADPDIRGFVDEKKARTNRMLAGLFKAIDKDGDGQITEQEFVAYLDWLANLRTRSRAACVTLVLADHSRGLFDLLDIDRDGRLSVREMRGAAKLLDQLDPAGKGYLSREDLPR